MFSLLERYPANSLMKPLNTQRLTKATFLGPSMSGHHQIMDDCNKSRDIRKAASDTCTAEHSGLTLKEL